MIQKSNITLATIRTQEDGWFCLPEQEMKTEVWSEVPFPEPVRSSNNSKAMARGKPNEECKRLTQTFKPCLGSNE